MLDSELAAQLSARLPALPERDEAFARSLLAGFARWQSFSPKQRPYVLRLLTPSTAPTTLADVSGILALLTGAKARGLKRPAFEVHAGELLRLSLAPDTGANPGHVYAKIDGAYVGKISPEGRLSFSRDVRPEQIASYTAQLARMAADPVGTAREFGRLTGRCCFCRLALRDERSTLVGYGPICAENFGLPWGAVN